MSRTNRFAVSTLCLALGVVGFSGCSGTGSQCAGGMCQLEGVALTETEVRERASTFAYDKLAQRSAPVTGPDNKPITLRRIDPRSWTVLRSDAGWRLTRHVTRDLWQVIECEPDGRRAFESFQVGRDPVETS